MFIREEDFSYFDRLYKSLDASQREKFLSVLLKASGERSGETVSKINVVGDEIFDSRGIEPREFITRTMIRKAYKAAKEG